MRKLALLIPIIVLLLAGYFVYQNRQPQRTSVLPTPSPTTTVKPTASAVPKPENLHSGWQIFTDTSQQVTFSYPSVLSTSYIRAQSWPPSITISAANFSCKEGGQIAGQPLIIQKTIGDTTYCIENITQGAAGTFYSDYTYSFLKQGKLIKLQFTIAYPQCDNYPDPKKTECQNERQSFDLDGLINQIAQTVEFQTNNASQSGPVITTPQANSKVESPLEVKGTVPAGWMFEGMFPIKLLTSDGQVIVQTQAKEVVPGSWNSGNQVEFSASLNFNTQAKSGLIVLEKDNPSGLPQNADSFKIPVIF